MDLSYRKATLNHNLYTSDFYDFPYLKDSDKRDEVVGDALLEIVEEDYFDGSISKMKKNGKTAYSVSNIGKKLVLRRMSEIFRKVYAVNIKPRNKIVRELKEVLREASGYRLYRLDIKSFFESCDTDILLNNIESDTPGITPLLFRNLIRSYKKYGGSGLPRGIEPSAVLSEVFLESFDDKVNSNENIYYYCRFVDDIVIITNALEDKDEFRKFLVNSLPIGLRFNESPEKNDTIYSEDPKYKEAGFCFPFIGYNFFVKVEKKIRKVKVDLSDKTVKKIKTKISVAILDFSRINNERLLVDRIKFLTTNRKIRKKNSSSDVLSGIYYDYPMIDYPSKSLVSLDQFLKFHFTSFNSRLYKRTVFLMSVVTKSEISQCGFYSGHKNRIFSNFNPSRIGDICRSWK